LVLEHLGRDPIGASSSAARSRALLAAALFAQ
jgi:hypothetical protein